MCSPEAMKRLLWLAWPLCAACSSEAPPNDPDAPEPERLEAPEGAIAFANVTVLPMTADEVLDDQVVVTAGDRILHVRAAAEVTLPEHVQIIDGSGKFLMPGLVDMHVHSWFEGENTVFVANGVTSVRNLFGDPQHLAWRQRIDAGELFGPTIYTAGPIVDGADPVWPGSDVVTDAASAASVVAAQHEAGYDMIKVYAKLSREAWQAILDEAEARGMPAVGHIPDAVDYREALGSWQSTNEHLERFAAGALGHELPPLWADWPDAFASIDPAAADALAEDTAAAGLWNTPTMVVYRHMLPGIDDRPELRFVHPYLRNDWATAYSAAPPAFFAAYAAYADAVGDWTGRLYAMGAPLLAGSDCTNAWVIAGFSLHEELAFLVQAGLAPIDALRAATANAAAAMNRDDFGTVEVGKRADLLLLDADPSDDVANAAARSGVMLRGAWHDEAALQGMLEALAASYDTM